MTLYLVLLLALLDHPRYRVREAATRALRPAVPLIAEALASPSGGAEYRRRCEWLLAEHADRTDPVRDRKLRAYLETAAVRKLPWISLSVVKDYGEYLGRAAGHGTGYDFPDWREATRLWALDRAERGEPWRDGLGRMWADEFAWNYRWRWGLLSLR